MIALSKRQSAEMAANQRHPPDPPMTLGNFGAHPAVAATSKRTGRLG
jgi:hypothetical protein